MNKEESFFINHLSEHYNTDYNTINQLGVHIASLLNISTIEAFGILNRPTNISSAKSLLNNYLELDRQTPNLLKY